MKLAPLENFREPRYPSRWRQLAAAVTATAALWLPACGGDGVTRLGGDIQPVSPSNPGGEVKPPEKPPETQPIAVPDPVPVRLGGESPPPDVRLPGQARAPSR